MTFHELAGIEVQINEEGFLVDRNQWTPEMARAIAEEAGIGPLTERHWKVISFCREDTARSGQAPDIGRIAALSGVGRHELSELFPNGAGKLAAQISGLPKPQGCI